MKMEKTECSKMSAYKIQMPGSYPEESIKHIASLLSVCSRSKWNNNIKIDLKNLERVDINRINFAWNVDQW
jgi:hypothetical protein